MRVRLLQVSAGRPEEIGSRRGRPLVSAIRKRALSGPVEVGPVGLAEDHQVDRKHHGGPEKAVYAVSADNWPFWTAARFTPAPGLFGENLTISGLGEQGARIGDIWRWGPVRLQIAQPRAPCNTLATHLGRPDVARVMAQGLASGWYLRVLTPGLAPQAPTEIEVEVADPAAPTVAECFRALVEDLPEAELARLRAWPTLSQEWHAALE